MHGKLVDYLLLLVAVGALGLVILFGGPIQSYGPPPYEWHYPIWGPVGLALAALAVGVVGARVLRRR